MKDCWNCKTDHRIHLKTAAHGDTVEAQEVCVVRGGTAKRPYLWIEGLPLERRSRVVTVTGNKRLRQIALAILAELNAKPPKRRVK